MVKVDGVENKNIKIADRSYETASIVGVIPLFIGITSEGDLITIDKASEDDYKFFLGPDMKTEATKLQMKVYLNPTNPRHQKVVVNEVVRVIQEQEKELDSRKKVINLNIPVFTVSSGISYELNETVDVYKIFYTCKLKKELPYMILYEKGEYKYRFFHGYDHVEEWFSHRIEKGKEGLHMFIENIPKAKFSKTFYSEVFIDIHSKSLEINVTQTGLKANVVMGKLQSILSESSLSVEYKNYEEVEKWRITFPIYFNKFILTHYISLTYKDFNVRETDKLVTDKRTYNIYMSKYKIKLKKNRETESTELECSTLTREKNTVISKLYTLFDNYKNSYDSIVQFYIDRLKKLGREDSERIKDLRRMNVIEKDFDPVSINKQVYDHPSMKTKYSRLCQTRPDFSKTNLPNSLEYPLGSGEYFFCDKKKDGNIYPTFVRTAPPNSREPYHWAPCCKKTEFKFLQEIQNNPKFVKPNIPSKSAVQYKKDIKKDGGTAKLPYQIVRMAYLKKLNIKKYFRMKIEDGIETIDDSKRYIEDLMEGDEIVNIIVYDVAIDDFIHSESSSSIIEYSPTSVIFKVEDNGSSSYNPLVLTSNNNTVDVIFREDPLVDLLVSYYIRSIKVY